MVSVSTALAINFGMNSLENLQQVLGDNDRTTLLTKMTQFGYITQAVADATSTYYDAFYSPASTCYCTNWTLVDTKYQNLASCFVRVGNTLMYPLVVSSGYYKDEEATMPNRCTKSSVTDSGKSKAEDAAVYYCNLMNFNIGFIYYPTGDLSSNPTPSPTTYTPGTPTMKPTTFPPTKRPTKSPDFQPYIPNTPTFKPTYGAPTPIPTSFSPTFSPTVPNPTMVPTRKPTSIPTNIPTKKPTKAPSVRRALENVPLVRKSVRRALQNMHPIEKSKRTRKPTTIPTSIPTKKPTKAPSVRRSLENVPLVRKYFRRALQSMHPLEKSESLDTVTAQYVIYDTYDVCNGNQLSSDIYTNNACTNHTYAGHAPMSYKYSCDTGLPTYFEYASTDCTGSATDTEAYNSTCTR
jgi:hypothetical protein